MQTWRQEDCEEVASQHGAEGIVTWTEEVAEGTERTGQILDID